MIEEDLEVINNFIFTCIPSRYDWKRLKATLNPNQTNKIFTCIIF